MAEERRLKIAKRQLLLAQIARREARYALANALAEEERSAGIQARANDLLSEYAKRTGRAAEGRLGGSLQADLAFIRSLQTMSETAGQAHKDARDQAQFQMRTLAAAETKMNARKERVVEEKRTADEIKTRREVAHELTTSSKVARKLQNRSHMTSPSPGQAAAKAALTPEAQ